MDSLRRSTNLYVKQRMRLSCSKNYVDKSNVLLSPTQGSWVEMANPEDDEEDDEDEAHEHDLSLVHHELVDWTAPSPTAVPLKEDEEVHDLTEKRDRSWEGDNQMAKANMMEKLTDLVVSDTCSSLKAVGVSVSVWVRVSAWVRIS